jgi:glycine dehydrogenase subunit 1
VGRRCLVDYVPITDDDRRAMLQAIGVGALEELFEQVPDECRLGRPLDLPEAMSEPELLAHLRSLAALNSNADDMLCFLGGGAYDHFVPSIVEDVARKSELYTSYTPYQPDISQGILQAIFEFQTLICELTGMDLANASVYDGATALAEACLMAADATGRRRVVIAGAVNPSHVATVATYVSGQGIAVEESPWDPRTGQTDLSSLKDAAGDDAACVAFQHPNFLGVLEPVDEIVATAHRAGALAVASVNPIALAILRRPGEFGADIAVGEAQPLGNALNFGGPYVGFMTCRAEHLRRMPGRLVGETQDAHGRRAFTLILQTREQHIRREKATSNICTNQALCALTAAAYLEAMGKQGLVEVATLCLQKAHYCAEQIARLDGFCLPLAGPFFHEFVVGCPSEPAAIVRRLSDKGILGGVPLRGMENAMLVCVTEQRTREQIDRYVAALAECAREASAASNE